MTEYVHIILDTTTKWHEQDRSAFELFNCLVLCE